MARTTAGRYRGTTADERVRDRRRRLMDAALEVVGTQGWSATTVRRVFEEARVAPRFFYESFPDLDTLVGAVFDEVADESLAQAVAAVDAAPDDLAARVRAGVGTFLHYLTDDPRRARLILSEAHGSAALAQRRFAYLERLAEAVLEQATVILPVPPESQAAGRAVSLLLSGGVAEMILVWIDGRIDLTQDRLVDVCVQAFLAMGDALPAFTAAVDA